MKHLLGKNVALYSYSVVPPSCVSQEQPACVHYNTLELSLMYVLSFQEHTADLKQRIEAQFSDLHQFLYQEEKLLQVKLKTEERRELIRLDEHKALLCVEISRLQRAVQETQDKLNEQDPFTLLRVRLTVIIHLHSIWKCSTK